MFRKKDAVHQAKRIAPLHSYKKARWSVLARIIGALIAYGMISSVSAIPANFLKPGSSSQAMFFYLETAFEISLTIALVWYLYHAVDQFVVKPLRYVTEHDGLTGAINQMTFWRMLDEAIETNEHKKVPLTLWILDIDFFKKVNDTYGHQAGDEVLQHVSSILKATVGREHVVGRVGGEEFGVLMERLPFHKTLLASEQLRKTIEETPSPQGIPVTISVGVADTLAVRNMLGGALSNEAGETRKNLVQLADTALYHSKKTGRNKVSCASIQLDQTEPDVIEASLVAHSIA